MSLFSVMMPAIRKTVKQIVPERVRHLRYELYEKARYYPEIVFSLGRRLECPFCKWHFRRFKPAGFRYPILSEKRVVGGPWHPDDVCPRCLSNARERLVYLFLKNRTEVYNQRLRILHIASEPNLMSTLLQCRHVVYITADLFESGVMTRFDILSMPFARDTFDVVICNHVMEHVSDDQVAMAEVFRVLRPDGWALLQAPMALALEKTVEDPSATSEADRIRLFGQRDHVRLYARVDYLARLEAAGFIVRVHRYTEDLGDEVVKRNGLVKDEEIYIVRTPNPKQR